MRTQRSCLIGEIGELLKRRVRKHRAGRIVRGIKNQNTGARSDFCSDFLKIRLEIIFFHQIEWNRTGAQTACEGRINRKPGIGIENFASRFD